MNEQELRALVERMIVELAGQAPTPQVKGADYHPMEPEGAAGGSGCLEDIAQVDLRQQYLVKEPRNASAFLDLKRRTPARQDSDPKARITSLSPASRMEIGRASCRERVF